MRRCGGPHQVQEDVWSRSLTSWWTGHGKDGAGFGCFARARDQGAILPNSWQRGVFDRGKEDGGLDGKFQESYRSVFKARVGGA